MIPFDIPRRARLCHRGQEPFLAGHVYFTRLKPLKEGEYLRHDFCSKCFAEETKTELFETTWKGAVPPKTVLEVKTDKLEKALECLKSHEKESDEDYKEAYLLALYLQRKKWLLLRGEHERKGKTYFLYEVAATEEMLEVMKMNLMPTDQHLQERIRGKLACV